MKNIAKILLIVSIISLLLFLNFGISKIDSKIYFYQKYNNLRSELKGDYVIVDDKIYQVVGVENDIIEFKNNSIFVNNIRLNKFDISNNNLTTPTEIKKNSVFLLNLDTKDVNDSRTFGTVNTKYKIKGFIWGYTNAK